MAAWQNLGKQFTTLGYAVVDLDKALSKAPGYGLAQCGKFKGAEAATAAPGAILAQKSIESNDVADAYTFIVREVNKIPTLQLKTKAGVVWTLDGAVAQLESYAPEIAAKKPTAAASAKTGVTGFKREGKTFVGNLPNYVKDKEELKRELEQFALDASTGLDYCDKIGYGLLKHETDNPELVKKFAVGGDAHTLTLKDGKVIMASQPDELTKKIERVVARTIQETPDDNEGLDALKALGKQTKAVEASGKKEELFALPVPIVKFADAHGLPDLEPQAHGAASEPTPTRAQVEALRAAVATIPSEAQAEAGKLVTAAESAFASMSTTPTKESRQAFLAQMGAARTFLRDHGANVDATRSGGKSSAAEDERIRKLMVAAYQEYRKDISGASNAANLLKAQENLKHIRRLVEGASGGDLKSMGVDMDVLLGGILLSDIGKAPRFLVELITEWRAEQEAAAKAKGVELPEDKKWSLANKDHFLFAFLRHEDPGIKMLARMKGELGLSNEQAEKILKAIENHNGTAVENTFWYDKYLMAMKAFPEKFPEMYADPAGLEGFIHATLDRVDQGRVIFVHDKAGALKVAGGGKKILVDVVAGKMPFAKAVAEVLKASPTNTLKQIADIENKAKADPAIAKVLATPHIQSLIQDVKNTVGLINYVEFREGDETAVFINGARLDAVEPFFAALMSAYTSDSGARAHVAGHAPKLDGTAPVDPAQHALEVQATEQRMSHNVVVAMNGLTAPKTATSGVWYEHEYEAAFPKRWQSAWFGGYADPHFFRRIAPFTWELLPGKSASKALTAWLSGLTIAECRTSAIAVLLDAQRKEYGDARFDELHGSEHGAPQRSLLKIDEQGSVVHLTSSDSRGDEFKEKSAIASSARASG